MDTNNIFDQRFRHLGLLRLRYIKHFHADRAKVLVSGIGYFKLRLNDRKVGDHVHDPGPTDYGKRILYSTFDVTEMPESLLK
ncbi:alpha-L-rhamnosidase N-terminal domain-containing protein [Paenibacillus sp. MBLB4367]|uniref:alpha-L-rhamnosidase N-terminal domain-containing protein n=1 Tax=Paenibacillus sp. MBLB4367 TaxID=3384767 RepID=UPI0039083A7F